MKPILKSLMLILTTCTFITSCGQENKNGLGNKNSDKISSTKTANHINIPGTRILLLQPSGFSIATNFMGLKKDNVASILIYDLIGGNYYTNAATFSKSKFESKGAKVFEYKEFTFNNYPAKFISMQGDPQTKSFALVFGDTTFSSMIMAQYAASDIEIEKQIKDAMFSIVYDKKIKIDPFASAKFSLDDSKSKFKFAKSSSGFFVYSLNGVNKDNYDNEPFITVSTLPLEGKNAKEIGDMMVQNFEKYGLTEKQINNISTSTVNDYSSYEFEMAGKIKNEKTYLYYLISTHSDKAIVIQARYSDNSNELILEIKKLSHTIKIK